MNRRTFLKRGALFVPAAFAVQRGIGQGLTQSDGPFISAGSSLNPAATSWGDRVVANGGAAPSGATLSAVSTFVSSLQAANVWTKILALNIYAPDSLIASITPLIKTKGSDPWTNHNFVLADLNKYGLIGDGSSKYLDTGVLATGLTMYDTSLFGMIDNAKPNTTIGNELASANSGASAYSAWAICFDDQATTFASLVDLPQGASLEGRVGGIGFGSGYMLGTRSGNASAQLYIANPWYAHALAQNNTQAVASPSFYASNFYAHARNKGGVSVDAYSSHRIKALGIGTAMSQADSLAIYNALKALRDAFEDGAQTYGQEWASRVVKQGGAVPSPGSITAVDTFLSALDSAGILTRFDSILAMAPDNLTAALTPIWRKRGLNDPWVNGNFVSGDLGVNGLQGATGKYLIPGLTGLTINPIDFGWTFYASTMSSSAVQIQCGMAGGGDWQFGMQNTAINFDSPFNSGPGRITATISAGGYIHGSRTAANASQLYKANSGEAHHLIGSDANTLAATPPATTLFRAMARTDGYSTDGKISYFAFGQSLTLAQSLAHYNAVQALRVAFGGGYV